MPGTVLSTRNREINRTEYLSNDGQKDVAKDYSFFTLTNRLETT